MHNTARIRLANVPQTKKCKRSTIYQMIGLFNGLPNELKFLPPKTFKRIISKRSIAGIPDD